MQAGSGGVYRCSVLATTFFLEIIWRSLLSWCSCSIFATCMQFSAASEFSELQRTLETEQVSYQLLAKVCSCRLGDYFVRHQAGMSLPEYKPSQDPWHLSPWACTFCALNYAICLAGCTCSRVGMSRLSECSVWVATDAQSP